MFNDKRDPNYTEKRAHYKEMLDLTAKLLTKQRRRVIAGIEKIERKAIDTEFWNVETEEMWTTIQEILIAMAYVSAQTTVETVGIGVDLGLVAESALDWAQGYSFELIKGINATTQRAVSKAVQQFIETPGMQQKDLIGMLDPLFGPARAQSIAVTEVTRAYAEGAGIAKTEIERLSGLQMTHIWNTNNDALVCGICEPLNQTKQGAAWWEFPPAHPNCRCWITQEIA